ncbi:UV radiation resistance protein and autophagy-related subunit 14-domain-containing protein [Amylocarpus encephaloides]|uniref:Autophagy-related protein 14 n=1 Tax=Amylocarpus encephaloides TaxID=45428 RepID=A0A9P8C179_9HELO|nr:UV radiation resistance protein and autophagy-related subunit 14-domain-containing protein [Amylocarpus encephaloides]
MQCDICFQTGGSQRPFLCAIDARNQLYLARIQNAQILLENETLGRQISALISESKADVKGNKESHDTSGGRQTITAALGEKDEAADRTQQIIARADKLRVEVEQMRAEVARRKASISRRKSEMASVSNGIDSRRAKKVNELDKSIKMVKYKWVGLHTTFAASRVYLCGEAAKLARLRRQTINGQEQYQIGGVGIIDLRALNTASPAQISTTLSQIVQLLMLCMHYLAIRPPAEIILPQPERPLPSIYSVASSYIQRPAQAPGNGPGYSSNPSLTASHHEHQQTPRLRPLHITKPLPILFHEDSVAYGFFIEGVALLAYNIAWVCKSQGVPVGDDGGFDDICNIGRNLHSLFIASESHLLSSRVSSNNSTLPKNRDWPINDHESRATNTESIMGRYSHGTAAHSLSSSEGSDWIRSWKILSPPKIADRLKSLLHNEVANKEWEVLHEGAWKVSDEMGDDGVVVGATKEEDPGQVLGREMQQSFMSCRTVIDAVEVVGDDEDRDRRPGTSGWTKLKPR